ncbi:Na(+)-translocating NADH-quinone reductase subunit C [Idiomarina tyrosinivorans]|uniref:Na(+)-translocating NADH-quinone reductase subunit C n=1 Tax=Idiomarina tyrosinivorans TaxID=1445662 RepID=A0A432ZPD2_9GAMM|nr:Na(+)-translocating NADH-quinone reductase subunit C [Idiomarina tyrosinivorans]RUO79747.1 Na(+)-translocating NADH-quinone reductase subunit C [Idiomarina tyrosinivorans]
MSKKNESLGKTIGVVIALCLVCSIIVSGAAIGLRPMQERNAALDMQRNILDAAGLLQADTNVTELYNQRVEEKVVSLQDYSVIPQDQVPSGFESARKAANDAALSHNVPKSEDIAGLGTQENLTTIYFIKDEQGQTQSVVLHIRGQGLWGTIYGLIALKDDYNTVRGVNFYEHSETPGLGGEIQNPNWVQTWQGKEIYGDDNDKVLFQLVKGGASGEHQVDALSGATLTSNGVTNLIQFWMGPHGYGPLLDKLRQGELING